MLIKRIDFFVFIQQTMFSFQSLYYLCNQHAMKNTNSTLYAFKEGAYFPPAFRMIGAVMILIGAGLLIQLNVIGLIVMVFGIVPLVAQKGIDVDFESEMYREPLMLIGAHIGTWHELPPVKYISMFSATKSQTMSFVSMSGSSKWKEIEVNLVLERNKRLNVFISVDYNKALGVARQFEKYLEVEIYDATGDKKVWLERVKG